MMDYKKAFAALHVLVKYLSCNIPAGTNMAWWISEVSGLLQEIQKVRRVLDGEEPKTVGVFGIANQGKSTLLNLFIGTDILPEKNEEGTTHCSIEVKNVSDSTEYVVTVVRESDTSAVPIHFHTPEALKAEIEKLNADGDVRNIRIEGTFNSYFSSYDRIVFVDTPGAEVGVGKDVPNQGGNWFDSDAERALAMLHRVYIVLFCQRIDYGQAKTCIDFYHNFLKGLEPINVLTCTDRLDPEYDNSLDEEETAEKKQQYEEVKKQLYEQYGFLDEDTVAVSARTVKRAYNKKKQENGSSYVLRDDDLRIGKLDELIAKIRERLSNDNKINRKMFHRLFRSYDGMIKELYNHTPNAKLLPGGIYIENLRYAVKGEQYIEVQLLNKPYRE
jgi:hypothetical protein